MAENRKIKIIVRNRKARYSYEITDTLTVGLVLLGTEVKSLRAGKANLQEAYCFINKGELFVKGLNISPYERGGYSNHEPLRVRKLLLKKKEIRKLKRALDEKGLTIVPLSLYFNERNFVKMDIGLGRGKKTHDKRHTIKERENKRDLDRLHRH